MSDALYRERAARRSRNLLLGAFLALTLACLAFGVYAAWNDTCTGSFDRSPESVARSFVAAVARGDSQAAAACWHHLAYLDVESGCSEICLSRLYGTPFELVDVTLSPEMSDEGRARIIAGITAACPDGEQNRGELTLDSVASNLPWRHWKIIRSTFGGPLSDLWCR